MSQNRSVTIEKNSPDADVVQFYFSSKLGYAQHFVDQVQKENLNVMDNSILIEDKNQKGNFIVAGYGQHQGQLLVRVSLAGLNMIYERLTGESAIKENTIENRMSKVQEKLNNIFQNNQPIILTPPTSTSTTNSVVLPLPSPANIPANIQATSPIPFMTAHSSSTVLFSQVAQLHNGHQPSLLTPVISDHHVTIKEGQPNIQFWFSDKEDARNFRNEILDLNREINKKNQTNHRFLITDKSYPDGIDQENTKNDPAKKPRSIVRITPNGFEKYYNYFMQPHHNTNKISILKEKIDQVQKKINATLAEKATQNIATSTKTISKSEEKLLNKLLPQGTPSPSVKILPIDAAAPLIQTKTNTQTTNQTPGNLTISEYSTQYGSPTPKPIVPQVPQLPQPTLVTPQVFFPPVHGKNNAAPVVHIHGNPYLAVFNKKPGQ
jgi:hypothetical protein